MGTINKNEFDENIKELVEKTSRLHPDFQWVAKKHKNGEYCANTSVVELNGKALMRTFHITYSASYQVPVLWFNFSHPTGALLDIEEILEFVPAHQRKAILADSLISISQHEHPVFNILFYHIHPCKTAHVMKNVSYDNYVISWLSIFGSLLYLLQLPNELFIKKDGSCQGIEGSREDSRQACVANSSDEKSSRKIACKQNEL